MHLALPALEALHKAWTSRVKKAKFAAFEAPLNSAITMIADYYDKTASSDAFIVSMRQFHFRLFVCSTYLILMPRAVLHPKMKMRHFVKHWPNELASVRASAETIVRSVYFDQSCCSSHLCSSRLATKSYNMHQVFPATPRRLEPLAQRSTICCKNSIQVMTRIPTTNLVHLPEPMTLPNLGCGNIISTSIQQMRFLKGRAWCSGGA